MPTIAKSPIDPQFIKTTSVLIDQVKEDDRNKTLISQLIAALQMMKEIHGDIPVLVWNEEGTDGMGHAPKVIQDWGDGRCLIE